MKDFIYTWLLSSLLLLSSCTSQLYMKSMKPAAYALPRHEKNILLVQVYDPAVAHKDQKVRDVYHNATRQAMASALEILKNAPNTQVQVLSQIAPTTTKNFSAALDPNTIQALAQQHQATHVLAFHGLSVKKTVMINTENFSEVDYWPSLDPLELQGSGSAPRKLSLTSNWTLYDHQGKVLDEVEPTVKKAVILNETITTSKAVVTNYLTQATETIQAAAKASGEHVAERYHPQVRVLNRTYYKWGALAEAAEWIEVKNWEEATKLLTPFTHANSPSLARKAAYNLAVVAEAQGNLQQAQQWAEIASKAGDSYAQKMLLELNQIL